MSKRREPIEGLPGWYQHPHMYESLCFWDGDEWTERVAPAPQAFDFWRAVQVVALGSLIAAVALGFLLRA